MCQLRLNSANEKKFFRANNFVQQGKQDLYTGGGEWPARSDCTFGT